MRFLGIWSTTSLSAVMGTTDSSDKAGPPQCLEGSTLTIKHSPSPLCGLSPPYYDFKTSLYPFASKVPVNITTFEKVPQLPVPLGTLLCQAIQLPSRPKKLLTFPSTHELTLFKVHLLQESNKIAWYILKERYNQDIKVQITTIDIKKEGGLYMKSPPPEPQCAKDVFQIQLPICGAKFSKNISISQVNMSENGST